MTPPTAFQKMRANRTNAEDRAVAAARARLHAEMDRIERDMLARIAREDAANRVRQAQERHRPKWWRA